MNIYQMVRRTKTYIAGDWTGDKVLIDKLHEWNNDEHLNLNFTDVHDFTSSSDSTLNCNIKKSLRQRLNISKTFVLIVGKQTKSLRSGACFLCSSYKTNYLSMSYCTRGCAIDNRSYVEYECEMALKDYNEGLLKNIVVIYNDKLVVDKSLCPDCLKCVGAHIPSDVMKDGKLYWNYEAIRDSICKQI